MAELSFGLVSGRQRVPATARAAAAPLVVAIHGGTYDSGYFDVPGFSLLDRAEANGIPIVAIDRPGYGDTPLLPRGEMTLAGQARFLTGALQQVWARHGGDCPGLVIVAHSIGAAIAAFVAAEPDTLPLLGLSISGVGLKTPPEHKPMWEGLPDIDLVELADDMKDQVMFGPEGSFAPGAPLASHVANRTAPKAELVDIVSTWQDNVHGVLERIRTPVHYRQGEFDRLWIVDAGEIRGFEQALSQSSRVDAEMLRGTGHCLDFHTVGPAFQLQQLSFALQCAAEAA